jgi:uncharacterized protein with beta-barrel porin domain
MNKRVGGAVAISVGTGGRWVGKVIRSAWWSAAAIVACVIGALAGASPGVAQDATWLAMPNVTNPDGNSGFDANANWTTAGGTTPTPAPGSLNQTGTATFGVSTGTSISFSAPLNALDGFTFTAAASNYAFFTNGTTLAFNGAGIVVNGNSTVSFTNNGGSTAFFNSSTAGSATITNNSNSLAQFGLQGGTDTATAGNAKIMNNGGSTVFSANTTAGSATITNNAGVTQFGSPGSTDTANAGNATIMNNSGVIGFFASTTAGSATITNNSDSSSTQFNETSNAGAAHITNSSGGRTGFVDTSTAGSAVITNNSGGFTTFGNPGFTDTATAGTATITNNSGGFTQFLANTNAGSATITNNSGGFTTFGQSGGGTATAGNATITNSSTITNSLASTQFFASTTAGSAHITNNTGGLTAFGDTSTAGSAHITNNNSGLTQFNATSTAGNAVITNSNFGLTAFGDTSTAGNATIMNNSGTVAFFQQSDGGSANLTNGAAGTIDFSGSTGRNGDGRLSVGSLAGTGTFIVGQQQLVTVTGSLAFTSGALYLVQVSGSNAGQIAVGGAATLAGNVEVDVLSRLTQKTTYTILSSANPLSGTFSSATLEFANNFARDPVLSIVGNNVLLTLQPGLLSPVLPANASANQVKVAGAIDNALLAGNNLSNAFSSIFNASGSALLNGVTQLSGETATGSQQTTFNAMGQFMGLLTDPFMNRGGGFNVTPGASGFAEEESQASAYAAKSNPNEAFAFMKAPLSKVYDPRWSVWASAFGGSQSTSGNVALGSNNTTSNIAGTAVGADYLFSPNTIAGFALAGGGTSFSVANGGTGRSDLFQMGAYVRHTQGPAYVSASLAYGWQDITTNRTVTVAGFDQLRAQFNANAWSGRLEGGYRLVQPWTGGIGITPYAAVQFVTFDLPAYAEQAITGLNTFALSYGAHDATDARSELGIRTDKSFVMADGILTLRGRLAWAHDYDPDRSIAATFQTLPGASFVVNGASQASDSALTTASIEMKWRNNWSVAATFEGEFSDVTNSYAGEGVVRYQW